MEYFYELHDHIDPLLPMTCRLKNNFSFKGHCHKNIEMLFITEGKGKFTIDDKSFSAQCGDTVIINPYRFHSMASSNDNPISYVCLITHSSFYESFGLKYTGDIFLSRVTDKFIMDLGLKIYDECSRSDLEYYKENVKAYINILIINLLRNYRSKKESATDIDNKKFHIASSVVEYIRRNFRYGIDIDAMATELGYCKFHLCRVFKEITGETILQYTNKLKCFYAEQLLATGNYTVHEVSELCGFESDSYFSLLFKKFRGVLPSSIKK